MSNDEFVWEGRGEINARFMHGDPKAGDDRRLGEVHFRLLWRLGCYNGNGGWARLSQTKLAKQWGVCRQVINQAIGELVLWELIEKRGQADTGENFCHYRTVFSNAGKAPGTAKQRKKPLKSTAAGGECRAATTPPQRTQKQGGECRPTATPVSIASTDTSLSVMSTPKSSPAAPSPSPMPAEAGSALIPFDEDSTDAVRGMTLGEIADPQAAATSALCKAIAEKLGPEFGPIDRLPFTRLTLSTVRGLHVDPAELIGKYLRKTRGKRVGNPDAYLVGMARDVVAKRHGVGVHEVALASIAMATGSSPAKAIGEVLSKQAEATGQRQARRVLAERANNLRSTVAPNNDRLAASLARMAEARAAKQGVAA
jgi:hypothetical protein